MKTATTPRYKLLHQQLRRQILSGEFDEGTLLPSENELSQTYSINRMTVRQALGELVKDGLIEKQKGKGSVVLANRKSLGLLSFKGFSEVVGATEHRAKTIYLRQPTLVDWETPFLYPLSQKEQDAGCILVERLRMADDEPIMLETTYIPNLEIPDFSSKLAKNGSLFNTLQLEYQIDILNVDQDIRAIKAPTEMVMPLNIAEDAPLLHICRKYHTSKPGFSVYSSLYCNTEKYTIGNNF